MNWRAEIEAARSHIEAHVRRTPVIAGCDLGLERPLDLKFEQMQHTGSFKPRGAFNTLLSSDVPEAGVVAASGGNHGAAVAFAARRLGHDATIFVPEMAGPAKIALIRETGATCHVVPGAYAHAMEAAQAFEATSGAMQVHAYDAPATVAGQGTLAAEWEDQGLEADTVVVAVGGGGLIAGAMAWLGNRRKVVAVEPATSCALNAALEAGTPVDVDVSGIAANALGARKIGQICFTLARETGVHSITVTDAEIAAAQLHLWRQMRQLVEPAGAAALAAVMGGAYIPARNERVAVLVCGANPAPDPLA
jgi:threonine dehydratase